MPGIIDINFLRDQRRALATKELKDKKIAKISSVIVGVFAIVFIGVIGVSIFFSQKEKKAQASIDSAQVQLKKMLPLEKDYVIYSKKLKILHSIDQERQTKRAAATFFYSIIPEEDELVDAQTDEKEHKIAFSILVPEIFKLQHLLDVMYGDAVEKAGYSIKGESLSRNNQGEYKVMGDFFYGSQVKK